MEKFILETTYTGVYRTIEVYLYTTRASMSKGIENYSNKYGLGFTAPSSDVAGFYSNINIRVVNIFLENVKLPLTGIIWLNKKDLDVEVMAHELMHAVTCLFLDDCADSATTFKDVVFNEESFERIAYLYGELFKDFYDQMKKYL